MTDHTELAKELVADAKAYRDSVYADDTDDMFTLAYQWQDKPLRHIHDLCNRIEIAAAAITALEAELAATKARGNRLANFAETVAEFGGDTLKELARQALTEGRDQ